MDLTRRDFIKIGFGVASAVALAGCGRPVEHDFLSQYAMPEYRLPGVPVFFATTCGDCGGGCGVAVRVMHGRANHVMGLPTHPMSHGKVCARGLSAVQALYHPDRLTTPLRGGKPADWKAAGTELAARLKERKPALWIVRRLAGSEGALISRLASASGGRVWVLDFPGSRAERMAMKAVAGKAELPYDDFAGSDYVVNFGGDPLSGHNEVDASWSYGQFRQEIRGEKFRGILVTFSSRMNMTGANSDKWVPVRPGGEAWAALGVARALQALGKGSIPGWGAKFTPEDCSRNSGVGAEVFERVARRLAGAKAPLVLGGDMGRKGVASLRLLYGMNRALGRNLATWEPDLLVGSPAANVLASPKEALEGLRAGRFGTVFLVDVDPAYLVPPSFGFAEALKEAQARIAFSSFQDGTTKLCDWVLPLATWMESWGDARISTPEGPIYGIRQPAVVAREGCRGLLEILVEAAGAAGVAGVPKDAQALLRGSADPTRWEDMLVRGGIWRSEPLTWEPYTGHNPPLTPPPAIQSPGAPPPGISPWTGLAAAGEAELEEPPGTDLAEYVLIPYPSPSLGDGRFSNRPWMLEFPEPLSTVVWDNFAELNPATARRIGVATGDLVTLKSRTGDITLPAVVTPAIHPEAVGVAVGYGRETPGHWPGVGTSVLRILAPVFQEGSDDIAWGATRVGVHRASGSQRMSLLDQRVNGLPRRVMPH